MDTLLFLGLLSVFLGVVSLGYNVKKLPWAIKYSPVFLSAIGGFLIWNFLANTVPVISYAEVNVLETSPHRVLLDLNVRKDRQCRLLDIQAYVVDKDGNSTPALLGFPNGIGKSTQMELGIVRMGEAEVAMFDEDYYEKFYFVTHHLCAFNIPIRSEFGETKLSPVFNLKPKFPIP